MITTSMVLTDMQEQLFLNAYLCNFNNVSLSKAQLLRNNKQIILKLLFFIFKMSSFR